MWWTVRTTLTDRPGSLARIAVACGEGGVNILGLQIFPTAGGGVLDEIVLETAEGWDARDVAGLVVRAGGREVSVGTSGSGDLVDQPVRWLRAATQVVESPRRRRAITEDLLGPAPSYVERARAAALDALLEASERCQPSEDAVGRVVYDVSRDAVVGRVGDHVVVTASLADPDESGDPVVTVLVSPGWRRRGLGTAAFRRMAGVARHGGRREVVLVAEGADEATLPWLDAMGLRGLIRLHDGLLTVRVPLGGVRPVPTPGQDVGPAR